MSRTRAAILTALAAAWMTTACDGGRVEPDGGPTDIDSGSMMDDDAGMTDEDAGTDEDDAGTTPDGGTDEDGGADEDSGVTPDGGTHDGGAVDVCGDGVVTGAETCDSAIAAGSPGACPVSCDDGIACTNDMLTGSAASCDAQCATTDITACTAGDSCCPTGCTAGTDGDCSCTPRTCAAGECGTVDNGCGGALDCGTCAVGGACDVDADCAVGVCVTEASSGWPGGICTLGCAADADCGAGAHCAFNDDDGVGSCVANCGTTADCRTGYTCRNTDEDVPATNECAPSGTGAGAIGTPCTSTADCAGGDVAFCAVEDAGWQGGFCTRNCTTDTDCVGASHCVELNADTGARICMPDCSGPTCRAAGYACRDLDGDSSNECAPSATGTGTTGSACTATFQCAGGADGLCVTDPAWLGGYCTVVGCTTDSDCASTAGGHCSALGGEVSVCTESCTTDADCRNPGYACYDADGNGSNECWVAATGPGAVGSACQFTWQCSGGARGGCVGATQGFRDGYCVVRGCTAGGTGATGCPTGSHCALIDPTSGGGVCLADCTTGSCRLDGDGYLCTDVDADTVSECFAAGTGTSGFGGACNGYWDCASGVGAICIPQQPDGSFPGGYCSSNCAAATDCATGTTCIPIFADGSAACLDNCTGTGMGDCRAGYTCVPLESGTASVCFDPADP